MRVLAVTQPSVAHPMAEVSRRLVLAGMDVRSVTAARFNDGGLGDGGLGGDGTGEPGFGILLVSNGARCDRAALARFPALVAVVYIASGTESVDLDAATERGVVVAHGHAEENAESMAEATILLMLAVLYDLQRAERLLRDAQAPPAAFARMLKGRVVGLVGFGKIARHVASRLQGWGAHLLVATRSPGAAVQAGLEAAPLDALLRRSDVVSLHAPLGPDTRHMIGRAQLELMRPGSVLINTGRGGLVDERALALVAPARGLWLGLDTFEHEPLPADSPLRSLPQAILTPHRVGHTVEGAESLIRTAVANIERIARGLPPLHARNQGRPRPPA